MSTLRIREITAADALDVLELLRGMHAEVGQTELYDGMATATIIETAKEGAAFVVEDEGGTFVASMGLSPMSYWYGPGSFIGEVWLYVAPAYRAGGEALSLLLLEARELASRAMMPVLIDHYRARGKRPAELSVIADRLSFKPEGQILMLSPQGGH